MRRGCVPLYLALLTITVLLFLSPTIAWRPWPHNKTKVQLDSIFGDSKKFESSSKFVHLKYHIGPVLTANITVHAIWYGAWQHNQKKIIREFINLISIVDSWHTSVLGWQSIIQMYTNKIGVNISRMVHLGQEKNDRFYLHGKSLTHLSIQRMIKSAITAKSKLFPVNAKSGLYLLLTSNDVVVQNFCRQVCGFHYFTLQSIVGYTLP